MNTSLVNKKHRKKLAGTDLDYFDTREAVEAIQAGSYAKLPYTSRILAEQLVRRSNPSNPETLTDHLKQTLLPVILCLKRGMR